MNERDDSGHDSPQERELHKARGFQTLLLPCKANIPRDKGPGVGGGGEEPRMWVSLQEGLGERRSGPESGHSPTRPGSQTEVPGRLRKEGISLLGQSSALLCAGLAKLEGGWHRSVKPEGPPWKTFFPPLQLSLE